MTNFQPVTHCIFDIDGLLLDTETIYMSTTEKLAEKYGKKYAPATRAKVLGTREQETAKIIVDDLKLPLTYEQFMQEVFSMQKPLLQKAKLMSGAERLVRHLAKHKIPIALATSSGKDSVEAKLASHKDLFSLFHHTVIGGCDPEVMMGKPAPDVFFACARRFPERPDPPKCLVFEDAPNGVLAAKAAGMQVVLVPDEKVTQEERAKATLVINSLLDFKPELFGLPPF